ncbi:MAG TPA: DinB family protein, partial [Thermomicrobiales bacterium]|nr:DinB family protein [Thermomicrobiales bacterium]
MAHPLVTQLRFARSEFQRGMEGVSEEDAQRRLLPMNSLSWMVGHLAWQEQRYWLTVAQGIKLRPDINELVGFGKPASTPPLSEMQAAWQEITAAADPFLDTLTADMLLVPFTSNGRIDGETAGTRLQRTIYHYFYHTGEAQAVRQLLGHTGVGSFIGDFG